MVERFEGKSEQEIEAEKEAAVFHEFLPSANIQESSLEQIPEEAVKLFESYGRKYISPEEYKAGNFEKLYTIGHDNGDITYVAEQTKILGKENYEQEKNAYFFESREGKEIGHGELRYNDVSEDKYFKNKPFVGYSATEKEYRRMGLGKRRIFEMNAYSQMRYQLPLYSGTVITPEVKRIWEALVKEGKAEKFREKTGRTTRVRFVLKKPN